MMIMSQDKKQFVIVGRGSCLSTYDIDGKTYVSCFFGAEDTETVLGIYNNSLSGQFVVQEIYSVIEDQGGNYKMKTAREVDRILGISQANETSLEVIGLSVRSYNALHRAGYKTVEEVQDTPQEKIMKIRNLGMKCFQELIDKGLVSEDSSNA